MKIAAFVVVLIGLALGLAAAVYWERSARVKIPSDWTVDPEKELASYVQWIIAIKDATEKAGELNAIAARLTAVSVLLATISVVLDHYSN